MKYDYKNDYHTQSTTFVTTRDLLADLHDEFLKLRRYEFISIYTNYKTIANIKVWMEIEGLAENNDLDFSYVQNLNDMAIMTLSYDGFIQIEKMYHDGICVTSEATLTYIHDTVCKTEVLLTHEVNNENILCFNFDEKLDEILSA